MNNSIFQKKIISIFILFILSINSSKNFASVGNNKNNSMLHEKITRTKIKFVDYRLISKSSNLKDFDTFIKTFIRNTASIKVDIPYLERKIVIRNDYLKLIKKYPSKRNIKSDDIKKEIKNLEILSGNLKDFFKLIHSTSTNNLDFLLEKELFTFFKVRYTYTVLDNNNNSETYNMVTFCPLIYSKHNAINILRRKIFLRIVSEDILANKFIENYMQKDVDNDLKNFEHNKIICDDFKKIFIE